MELQIEENIYAHLDNRPNGIRSVGGEELKPELKAADLAGEPPRQGACFRHVRQIKGDEYALGWFHDQSALYIAG